MATLILLLMVAEEEDTNAVHALLHEVQAREGHWKRKVSLNLLNGTSTALLVETLAPLQRRLSNTSNSSWTSERPGIVWSYLTKRRCLQEQSLQDLQRNVIISALVRIPEYYGAILILTSNHVDTFDKALNRRIRNITTTARQLARHGKKLVEFAALRHVITVSTKFDKYLKGINEDLDDKELAREVRLR